MKTTKLLLTFALFMGALTLNACGEVPAVSDLDSASVGGVLQDSNSLEFNPFEPSTPDSSDNSSSELPPEEEVLPYADTIGEWEGYDDFAIYFVFTVNDDGSAVLENEYKSWNFTFDRFERSEYFFVYDDDDSVEVGIWNLNSNSTQFYIYDENFVVNDFEYFGVFNEYVSIEKK